MPPLLPEMPSAQTSNLVRRLRGHDFTQRGQQAVDFFECVVVDEADAEETAGFFYV